MSPNPPRVIRKCEHCCNRSIITEVHGHVAPLLGAFWTKYIYTQRQSENSKLLLAAVMVAEVQQTGDTLSLKYGSDGSWLTVGDRFLLVRTPVELEEEGPIAIGFQTSKFVLPQEQPA